MRYELLRYVDPDFFSWLASLDPSKTGSKATFNKRVTMGYIAMDTLATWADDRHFHVPDGMGAISQMAYFMTPGGKSSGKNLRLFVAFIYGNHDRAVVMEITLLQLLLTPLGVRTPTGRKIHVPLVPSIAVPNDGVPIRDALINPSEESYLGVREEETVNFLVNEPKLAKDAPPPNPKRHLIIELGHPALAEGTINKNPELESLATSGGRP
jgi:hypothetical protein